MNQGFLWLHLDDLRDQFISIVSHLARVPARDLRRLGGLCPNAKSGSSIPKWRAQRPVCRGKHGVFHLWQINGNRVNTDQWRDYGRQDLADFCEQRIPKRLRPALGPRQKQSDLRVLCIVCHGVRCYLGGEFRAMEQELPQHLNILGIESSCDDTAAAVVRGVVGGAAQVLSSVVVGQTELHAAFGGVVPEIAARAHVEKLDVSVMQALAEADMSMTDIDAIAVTAGPGLIGGVVSGVMLAKGLSAATGIPIYGVNHLAGHALTPRLTDGVEFPYLILLVSGGHCQFLIASGPQEFRRLGGTIDDAPGEAFDKVARLIGLSQPGGPMIEKAAKSGDPTRFKLPRPLLDRAGCDMSFSGLKTAVLRTRDGVIAEHGGLSAQDQADLAAGFQAAVADVLAEKSRRAMGEYLVLSPVRPALCVAGGVAANMTIRGMLETVCTEFDADFIAPPLALCTDNAAMIAYAALAQMGERDADNMTLSARPRWPLDTASPSMLGSGKKGAKA